MEFAPWHWVVVGVVVVLLFGGRKLPELGKGLAQGIRSFKDSLKSVNSDDSTPHDSAQPPKA